MKNKPNEDGGPAFPMTWSMKPVGANEGMTLLDYFAGKAIEGSIFWHDKHNDPRDFEIKAVAEGAYKLAQAMLKERARIAWEGE